jgi:hypothetical protein
MQRSASLLYIVSRKGQMRVSRRSQRHCGFQECRRDRWREFWRMHLLKRYRPTAFLIGVSSYRGQRRIPISPP